jgi:hypothetical protein
MKIKTKIKAGMSDPQRIYAQTQWPHNNPVKVNKGPLTEKKGGIQF